MKTFLSRAVASIKRAAKFLNRHRQIGFDIFARIAPAILSNRHWTDDQLRDFIVAQVKDEIGERHPAYAIIIGIVIDLSVDMIRAQLNKEN